MSASHSKTPLTSQADSSAAWRFPAGRAHAAFLLLLAVSFIVPYIHNRFMGRAIESARGPELMPLYFLMLRDYGALARWLPITVAVQWLSSLRIRPLRSPTAVVVMAIIVSLAMGFYAFFCAAVLAFHISLPAAP